MRKLDRTGHAAPACLAAHDHLTQSWSDLDPVCKRQIHEALTRLQGGQAPTNGYQPAARCAYCEGALYRTDCHIEHFRRKRPGHHPQLTFAWDNLFLSCNAREHCGHFKDRRSAPPYDPDQLLKPDQDEPGHYLFFHSSGQVRARSGLSAGDEQRAMATIRVFGLDDRTLAGRRAKAVAKYKAMLCADLDELAAWSPAERAAYLDGEVQAACHESYATAIQHFLQGHA